MRWDVFTESLPSNRFTRHTILNVILCTRTFEVLAYVFNLFSACFYYLLKDNKSITPQSLCCPGYNILYNFI
jgi:hypothetical protein